MLLEYAKKATVHGHLHVPQSFDSSKHTMEPLFTVKLEMDMSQLDCIVLLPTDYYRLSIDGFKGNDVLSYSEQLAKEDREVIEDHY